MSESKSSEDRFWPSDKRMIMAVIALAFVAVVAVSVVGIADDSEATASWNIGSPTAEDVTATYDFATGVLTITGTGDTMKYDRISDVPWYSYSRLMSKVVISDGVTSIGMRFQQYESLISVSIGNGIKEIGKNSFYKCTSLSEVTIGSSVETIGEWAFAYTAIVSITLPEKLTTIDDFAFYESKLTSLSIPKNVVFVGEKFCYKAPVTTYTVADGNQCYVTGDNGVLFNKEMTTLVAYPIGDSRSSYAVPDSIVTLGNYSFASCEAISSLTFGPNSVLQTVGEGAFIKCTSLASIVLPSSVTRIGVEAFRITAIETIEVPASVSYIGSAAFSECALLTCAYIRAEDPITDIGSYIFNNVSIKTIYVPYSKVDIYRGASEWWHYSSKIFADMTECTVSYIKNQPYCGKQITPEVTVKAGDKVLTLGKDYTVEYGENTKVGKGTVTIKGAGEFNGSIDKTFNIVSSSIHVDSTKEAEKYNDGIVIGIALIASIIVVFALACFIPGKKW